MNIAVSGDLKHQIKHTKYNKTKKPSILMVFVDPDKGVGPACAK